ncbi:MAG: 6-phosphofructokinase [Lachnospiraceae bacterium]|nr:6-phosphofructokinase [Lachnospiraceae bacterium]
MEKKNLLVGQSGGPTAVINSSLYGVVKAGLQEASVGHVYGMLNGIEGFLQDRIWEFGKDISLVEIEKLKTTPGAYLGSCRYKLPECMEDAVFAILFKKLKALNIGYVVYIGGNDSMDTVSKMSRYAAKIGSDIKVCGAPKTVDNDLVLTDHTPGFGSAAKYVATTVREITIDANVYETKSVTIVEIMGRHAGWLTAAGVLARKYKGDNPLLVYLPEVAFEEETFIRQVEAALEKNINVIVCISEGIHDAEGVLICEYGNEVGVDSFGHKMLAGAGKHLENLLRDRLAVKVRSVELNVVQRCSTMMMSKTDQQEAIGSGTFAVASVLQGVTGKMISFVRKPGDTYAISYGLEDVNEICNKEKTVPLDWIIADGSDIADAFLAYCEPLIKGNVDIPCDGLDLPDFVYRG